MSYNKTPRPSFSKKKRAEIFNKEDGICHECGNPILPGQPWDVSHEIPRELFEDGSFADSMENLRVIHSHPLPCHKKRTAKDVAAIAKSNRLRIKFGLDPARPKKHQPKKIKSRGFPRVKRPFPKRIK